MNVLDPGYWADRLAKCGGDLHRAMYEGNADAMSRCNEHHRMLVASIVKPDAAILDVGCGYGRLLQLLPSSWRGVYCGIDISPEFIAIARMLYPGRDFRVADARTVELSPRFDVAIAIGVRGMIIREADAQAWEDIHANISKYARAVHCIEWDQKYAPH